MPDEGFAALAAARVAPPVAARVPPRRFHLYDLDVFVAYRSSALVARYQRAS